MKKGTKKTMPKRSVKKTNSAETDKKKVDKANKKAKKLLKTPKPTKNKVASAIGCSDSPGWDCGPIKEHCGKPSMKKFCKKTCGACTVLSSSKKPTKKVPLKGKEGSKKVPKKPKAKLEGKAGSNKAPKKPKTKLKGKAGSKKAAPKKPTKKKR